MLKRTWQPIVVGVDASPAAADAVRVGWAIAAKVGTTCHLVHATPDAWSVPSAPHAATVRPEVLNEAVREAARSAVRDSLAGQVPEEALAALDIRTGRVLWEKTSGIFGTWLGYSEERDVLLQAGSMGRERAADEVGQGMGADRGRIRFQCLPARLRLCESSPLSMSMRQLPRTDERPLSYRLSVAV